MSMSDSLPNIFDVVDRNAVARVAGRAAGVSGQEEGGPREQVLDVRAAGPTDRRAILDVVG